MRFLVWNCQGLDGSSAISQLEEACKHHSPDIVFISETKNGPQLIRNACRKVRYNDFLVVDPIGLAGGLALLYQQGITINSVDTSFCTIEVEIFDHKINSSWWFVGVYASPNPLNRRDCWSFLSNRKAHWGSRFVLACDFNDILTPKEKLGGQPRSEASCLEFRNFVQRNKLIDLGYSGQFWTWKRISNGIVTTFERLDRFLASSDWNELYPRLQLGVGYLFW